MCLVYCNADGPGGNAKGTNGRVIEDNHEVFTSAERIRDARLHEGRNNHVAPLIPVTPSIFLMSFVP